MASAELTPAPSEAAPMSVPKRLLGVFFWPGETFADVARRPDFIVPLVLLVLASIAITEIMLAKIGMAQLVRNSLEQSGRTANMSPEQLDQAVAQAARIGAIVSHISGVIGAPIFLLIIAGIGILIVSAIMGAPTSFLKVFAASSYACMIRLLGALLALPLIFFGDAAQFNPENMTPTNPAFFLDPRSTPRPLIILAGGLDLLTLWFLIVLGIGLSKAADGKVKASTVFLLYLGLWVLWTLGRAGLATLM